MLKYIYRIIILVAIFIASLNYFSKDIKEVVFDIDNTTVMEEATFPLVTIKTDEEEINLLHGYSSNLDANKLREFVTPLGQGQEYEVIINQKEYEIKKLNYEIREFLNNELVESGSVSVFDDKGEEKIAKIKFHTELIPEKEYAVKITLISSTSQKMYYYHRIKIYKDAHLREQLSFIRDIHNATFDKNAAQDITKYLEYKPDSDATSLAYVNIHSNLDLITWGNLKPVILTKVVPSVIEIYSDIAIVRLDYFIEAEIDGNSEKFQVTEFYRVRYSENRMFLLNYERWMEALFDVNLASISKSQFKLGISSDYEIPYLSSADRKKMAFVRNRELWFYNMDTNEIFKVFSFRQEETDYIRDLYDQHDIRILNMDAEGNMDYIVYGYMNRGQYEGKVALVLYRYIRAENRNEELVYIPVDEPYQTLKENIGEFAYVNSRNVFYFHMYHNIYSYDLITRKLSSLTDGVQKDQVVVLENLNYVAWQDNADPKLAKNIYIMNMESGEIQTVSTKPGYNILLMDKIDSNIIYGYVKEEDMITHVDGRRLTPLSEVEIISVDKKVLKSYKEAGYYVTDLTVNDNIVELFRLQKTENGDMVNYIPASKDYIMNQVRNETPLIEVTTRVTEQALTELYLTLPSGFTMTQLPKISSAVNTIISQDPTVRLSETDQKMTYYYPYVQGRIEGAYKEAAGAIEIARNRVGVVLDSNMQLIWERGVKVNSNTISGFDHLDWSTSTHNTMETCLKLLLSHQGVSVNKDELALTHHSALDILSEYSKYPPVRLTGITLDDALYYVSTNRPVIAMTNTEGAVVIYGFDSFNIMVINPKLNKVERMGLNDSAKLFEEAGNVFISFLK